MPSNLVKKVITECKINEKDAEQLWEDAKKIVLEKYLKIETESDKYFALVTSIFKNLVGANCRRKMGWSTKSEELKQLISNSK